MEAWRAELYSGNDELYHYGILGMKWGIRRFQNPDGTLTAAGRRRYASKMYVRTNNAVADRMNNGEIKRFNEKHGHLAKSNPGKYQEEFGKLRKKLWDEEAKNTERAFNTPRKSTRELDRLWDTRYSGQESASSNERREKAKEQGKSALKLLGGSVGTKLVSGLTSSALYMSGRQSAALALRAGGNLAGVGMGAASVVQAARAGYNYLASR